MPNRYTLLLDDGALKAVERLRGAYGLKTKADVYDLAIRLLSWATDQTARSHEVGRFANGEFQPLLMPYEVDGKAWKVRPEAEV